jgi:hypothetical protein
MLRSYDTARSNRVLRRSNLKNALPRRSLMERAGVWRASVEHWGLRRTGDVN